jgi:hypothetical protein
MSTKTIKQRIALVAVTALTAGLFSVVSAPASNATVGLNVAAGGTTNPAITDTNVLYQATIPSTSGTATALTNATNSTVTSATQVGLVNTSSIGSNYSAGTTQTAVLVSTGAMSVYTMTKNGEFDAITVSGGVISASTGDYLGAGRTVASSGQAAAVEAWGVVITPNSGATSMTVSLWTGGATSALSSAVNATSLTLSGQITVTISAAADSGTLSTAKSGLWGASGASDTGNTSNDTQYLGVAQYNGSAYLEVRTRDAYSTPLTSTTALLQITATGGAYVKQQASGGTASGTASTDYLTGTAADNRMVKVTNPTTKPMSTTVTATYNGTVIGSQTIVFTGEVASIKLYDAAIGKSGSTNVAYYKLFDAAGNLTYTTFGGSSSTAIPFGNLAIDSSLFKSPNVSAGSVTRNLTLESDYSTENAGKINFTCSSTAGKGNVGLVYTNNSGSIIKSNALEVSCAGAPFNYTASWDKASYVPGDVATLTVKIVDSKGNLAGDSSTIAGSGTSLPTVTVGGLDKTVVGPTATDAATNGLVKYKYTIGATEGTYTGVVDFPLINANNADIVPVTTSLTVKASSAAVSNADVLKSIVALIASINKQIQALQKLILKR